MSKTRNYYGHGDLRARVANATSYPEQVLELFEAQDALRDTRLEELAPEQKAAQLELLKAEQNLVTRILNSPAEHGSIARYTRKSFMAMAADKPYLVDAATGSPFARAETLAACYEFCAELGISVNPSIQLNAVENVLRNILEFNREESIRVEKFKALSEELAEEIQELK